MRECSSLVLDFVEFALMCCLTFLYLVPAIVILKKYRVSLDRFSFYMIILYLFGFISKTSAII